MATSEKINILDIFIQHFFICSDVSEDDGIEPRTIATSALAVRRSKHSATSLPQWTLLQRLKLLSHLVDSAKTPAGIAKKYKMAIVKSKPL